VLNLKGRQNTNKLKDSMRLFIHSNRMKLELALNHLIEGFLDKD